MGDGGRTGAAARATVFAGSTVGLAVVAHVVGGGAAPGLGLVAFLAVVCGLLWSGVAGAVEQTLPRLLAGVVAVQIALHVALLGHGHAGHVGHAGAPMAGHAHGLTLSAVAGHLVASLLLAWWLRLGEQAVWSATRRLVGRLLPAAPRPVRLPTARRLPAPSALTFVPVPAGAVLLPARRGPPAVVRPRPLSAAARPGRGRSHRFTPGPPLARRPATTEAGRPCRTTPCAVGTVTPCGPSAVAWSTAVTGPGTPWTRTGSAPSWASAGR